MNMFVRFLTMAALVAASPALASSATQLHPKQADWAFDGVFGKLDNQAAQRGFQVYKEVCSACHSLKRVSFRQLQGIGFSEPEVKSLAAGYTVKDGPNDMGEMFERPGKASDFIPGPYANDNAARAANNGGLPPDMSLLVKARHDGANYIYSILTGYAPAPAYRCAEVTEGKCVKFDAISAEEAASVEAPAEKPAEATVGQVFHCSDVSHKEEENAEGQKVALEECREIGPTMHYNPYFDGKQIAMAQPLKDEQVTYQDETKATLDQQSHDLVTFLQWAAEPEMQERKRMGIHVLLFLGVMTTFFYLVKKRIWSDLH